MALEVGSIVEGTVTGLAKFGVFVEIADKKIGLVHISEVAGEYVSDVNDYLKLHDKVKVKIISVDEKGKIALSIKQPQGSAPLLSKEHAYAHRRRPFSKTFRFPAYLCSHTQSFGIMVSAFSKPSLKSRSLTLTSETAKYSIRLSKIATPATIISARSGRIPGKLHLSS
jgi:predicted RNA-binding protein with RPS1 domain